MSFADKYPGYKSFQVIRGSSDDSRYMEGWDLLDIIPDAAEIVSTVYREKVFFIPSNDNRDYNDREKKIMYQTFIKLRVPLIIFGKKEESRIEELKKQIEEKETQISRLNNDIDNVKHGFEIDKKEIESIKAQFVAKDRRIKELSESLDQSSRDKTAYKARADALAQSNASYPQVISDLNRQIEQLKDLLAKGSESPVSDARNIDLD